MDSPGWSSNGLGAVTFGSGTTGISGAVTSTNSLVGSTANDYVGTGGVTALSNGNYVVDSFDWDGGDGAVTFGDGKKGISGPITASNSLIGSDGDLVGHDGSIAEAYTTPRGG